MRLASHHWHGGRQRNRNHGPRARRPARRPPPRPAGYAARQLRMTQVPAARRACFQAACANFRDAAAWPLMPPTQATCGPEARGLRAARPRRVAAQPMNGASRIAARAARRTPLRAHSFVVRLAALVAREPMHESAPLSRQYVEITPASIGKWAVANNDPIEFSRLQERFVEADQASEPFGKVRSTRPGKSVRGESFDRLRTGSVEP